MAGKWGIGADRADRLQKAGYSYKDVQAEVNRLVSQQAVYYVVKAGDTLSGIARKYRIDLKTLIARNPQISNVIKVGQKVRIK